ncbi:MAG TPA: sigma-70 family RNA polymerase sigma factor [Candidatus Tumulicola sp.]
MTATESFERGFMREYADVVRCAHRVLADASEAEDVAQEVFVRFVGRTIPDPAILRITAVRLSLNVLRSRKRRLARELNDHRSSLASVARTGTPDPFAIVDASSRRLLVQAALVRLRPRDAELLMLRYSGADYRDLAHSLGIDAAQVGTRLARAERAFRKEINDAALR